MAVNGQECLGEEWLGMIGRREDRNGLERSGCELLGEKRLGMGGRGMVIGMAWKGMTPLPAISSHSSHSHF